MKKEQMPMMEIGSGISKKLYVQIEERINTRKILSVKKDALTLEKVVKRQWEQN